MSEETKRIEKEIAAYEEKIQEHKNAEKTLRAAIKKLNAELEAARKEERYQIYEAFYLAHHQEPPTADADSIQAVPGQAFEPYFSN